MNRPNGTTLLVTALAFSLGASSQATADFTIDWWTVDGGGGMWATDPAMTFELSGTIGQPDAGTVMVGGPFELVGGFWALGAPCTLLGDLNGDGVIDLLDLSQLLAHFGTLSGATYEDGDLNGDGAVDLLDLSELLIGFGSSC